MEQKEQFLQRIDKHEHHLGHYYNLYNLFSTSVQFVVCHQNMYAKKVGM